MGIIDLGTYVAQIDLKITEDANRLMEKLVLVKVQSISCIGGEYSAVAMGFDPKAPASSVWLSHKNEPNPNLGLLTIGFNYQEYIQFCI